MANVTIGKFTKKDHLKAMRECGREMELENSHGWSAKHKVHKSKKKQVHRKRKHKGAIY